MSHSLSKENNRCVYLRAFLRSCSPDVRGVDRRPAESGAYRIYVTNETSGDMSVIDSATMNVIATVPLGKRPRGNPCEPGPQDDLCRAQRIADRGSGCG